VPSARRRGPLGPVLSCADATKPWKALPVESVSLSDLEKRLAEPGN